MMDLSRGVARWVVVALVVTGVAGLPNWVHADKCDDKQEDANSGGKNYKTVVGPNGRKVFVIEKAFVVCGKVPKPNVIYVLQASSINYEWENLKHDFLPKIRDTVNKAPF